ncbi:MAG: H-NS histone family protein [Hyphomicrobiaceae bacterium]
MPHRCAKEEFRNEVAARGLGAEFPCLKFFGSTRGAKPGGKVAVKYRNPDNPSDTWTGRGRQPKWLAAALKKGAKIADFAL